MDYEEVKQEAEYKEESLPPDGDFLLIHDKCWLSEEVLFPNHGVKKSSTVTSWVPASVLDGTLLQKYRMSNEGVAYTVKDQDTPIYPIDTPDDASLHTQNCKATITSKQYHYRLPFLFVIIMATWYNPICPLQVLMKIEVHINMLTDLGTREK